MKKRIVSAMLIFVLATLLLPVWAFAYGPIENDRGCSVSITFRPGELSTEGTVFRLYKIADVSIYNEYTAASKFTKYPNIATILSYMDSDITASLCTGLPGYIAENKVSADISAKVNADSAVELSDVPTGLYFVTGSVFKDGEYLYTPESFILSLPMLSASDEWDYSPEVNVKYLKEKDKMNLSLEVLKVWSDSSTNLHSSDKVTVKLYKNTQLYATVELSKENNWTYKWEKLDNTASWSFTEGTFPGYTTSMERKGNRVVITNTAQSAKKIDTLPQTGLVWWPVPALLAAGIMFMSLGLNKRSASKRYE